METTIVVKCPCETDAEACCACVSMHCDECHKELNHSKFQQGRYCSNCGRPLKQELSRNYISKNEHEAELARVQSENERLTINMNAYGLTAKRLAEENERLHASCTELTQCCTKLETLYKIECKRVDTVKADTVQQIQLKMAMHYGTYTDKDMTPITEVFSLLDQIAKEMLEGQSNGIY